MPHRETPGDPVSSTDLEFDGAPAPFCPPEPGSRAVYRGARVLDADGRGWRAGTTIVVDGSSIVRVAPDGEVPDGATGNLEVVDLAGRFVIPGLIDSHQHIATPPNRPVAEAWLRRQVHGGVTAIRDMADDLRQVADLARAARVGEIAAPDIFYAALMAGPSFFDDPRTWQVAQGAVPGEVPWMQAVTDETDLVLAVARGRGTFATAIKIYANLEPDLVARITEEAHRQGMLVWAHAAVFPARPADVVAARVDSVSHVDYLAYHLSAQVPGTYREHLEFVLDTADLAGGESPEMDELFGRMAEQETILDATASMWTRSPDASPLRLERPGVRARAAIAAPLTAQAHRAGVPIAAGTDYEAAPDDPWPALHHELAFLVEEVGMSPAEAIRSGTVVGAAALGLGHVMGTIEPEKLANFVVLAEDPLDDLGNLRSIVTTVKRGRRFPRASGSR